MDNPVGDLVAKGYDEYSRRKHLLSPKPEDHELVRNLSAYLKINAKILDVGCGSGTSIAPLLIEEKFDYTGIDISSGQLKLASLLNPNGRFIKMDMLDITFPENSFDCVICINSIVHVPMYYHPKLIKSFFKILKPGGILLITTGTVEKEEIRTFFEEIPMYFSHYNQDKNISMVIESNFKILTKPVKFYSSADQILIFAKKPGDQANIMEYSVKNTEITVYDANTSLPSTI